MRDDQVFDEFYSEVVERLKHESHEDGKQEGETLEAVSSRLSSLVIINKQMVEKMYDLYEAVTNLKEENDAIKKRLDNFSGFLD
jgi:hypothetical protein